MLISDAPKASFEDVSYALSCFLLTVVTKNPSTPGTGPVRLSFADEDLELPRSLTFATPHESTTSFEEISESFLFVYDLRNIDLCLEGSARILCIGIGKLVF